MSFADNPVAAGGTAKSWVNIRFSMVPRDRRAPNFGRQIKLRGFSELSGAGYTQEGVTPLNDASGEGQAVKITKGRKKAKVVTIAFDPDTYEQYYRPNARNRRTDTPMLFDCTVQYVDDATGETTRSDSFVGCIDTDLDIATPNDGTPILKKAQFTPTRHSPPRI